ncbi:MAG TPA: D-alanyl-D-alanine carboxypeptidase family protein [Gaiellaceae bacterium]
MRRVALAAVAIALAWVGSAQAASPPQVHASAYLVENATTGEVLASSNPHAAVPIASITKLMTVRIALRHHRLGDVVAVDPRAAAVGESTADLDPGERLTISDLVKAALIQSANDAADALALSVSPSFESFAGLMNAEAAKLGLRDTHFVRPDGLDAPGERSSAADVTRLARVLMRNPFVRRTVAEETATIAGGKVLHTWDDLLGRVPGVIGVKTGHTDDAGWCQVAALRGPGGTLIYATILGEPSRSVRNDDLAALLEWGGAQYRVAPVVQARRIYARAELPYGEHPLALVAARPLLAATRVGRPLTERVIAARSVSLPVRKGTVLGRVQIWSGGRLVGGRELVAARSVPRPGALRRLGWYAGRSAHHLVQLITP